MTLLEALIRDAERRIGSYIASGGNQSDKYVQDQIIKIRVWEEELNRQEADQT